VLAQPSTLKTTVIALAILLTFAGNAFFAEPAKAVSGCPSTTSVSERQRHALKSLPHDLQTILKAVRRQKKTVCEAPDLARLQTAAIDPLSIPLNLITPASSLPTMAVPDEVIAVIPANGSAIETVARNNGLTVRSRRRSSLLGGFIVRFGIPDGRSPVLVAKKLRASDAVETPGPNHIYQLQGSVFDEARYAPQKIGLPSANSQLTGQDILIGIIDTAIDPSHPDLKGAVLASFDALPDQPVSNRRHGTAVAGLIAGRSMIKGIAPQAKLLVARAFDNNAPPSSNTRASATSYQLLAALDWTISKGARIINMSFAGPRNNLMSKALARAALKKVLLIAAAGNNGPRAPAAYPAAEQSVLAVTATDIDNRIYRQANVGQYVFVAAPGVDVLAAAPGKGVDLVSGTSFAAPFLTGLAALMLEQNKTLTPHDFARRIEQTSHDLGQPGRDRVFGVGLADTNKALFQK
jgi:subtilisin family serine protease